MWPLMWFLRMLFAALFRPVNTYCDKLADEVETVVQKYVTKEEHATTLDRR
jgi:hypothetical protein